MAGHCAVWTRQRLHEREPLTDFVSLGPASVCVCVGGGGETPTGWQRTRQPGNPPPTQLLNCQSPIDTSPCTMQCACGVLCHDREQGVWQGAALCGPGKGCVEEHCCPKCDDAVEGLPGKLQKAQGCRHNRRAVNSGKKGPRHDLCSTWYPHINAIVCQGRGGCNVQD